MVFNCYFATRHASARGYIIAGYLEQQVGAVQIRYHHPFIKNELVLVMILHNIAHFALRSIAKKSLKILKGVIRSRKSEKDIQYNGQKIKDKRTNNDLQNITQKIKDRTTRIPLKPG